MLRQLRGQVDFTRKLRPLSVPFKNAVYSCPVDHEGTTIFIQGRVTNEDHLHPVVFIHDLFQSSRDYADLAEQIAEAGFSTYCFDLRGHGDSGGKPGHIENFDTLVRDLLQVVAWIRYVHGGRNPTLVCQGVGCIVGLFFARGFRQYINGLVLAAPTIQLARVVGPYQRLAIKTLAELFPTWNCPAYLTPPFARPTRGHRGRLTNATVVELLNALSQSRKLLIRLPLRCLFVIPEEDTICLYDGLKRIVAKNRQSKAISVLTVPSKSHSPLTEQSPDDSLDTQQLIEWLSRCDLVGEQKWASSKSAEESDLDPELPPWNISRESTTTESSSGQNS